MRAHNAPRPTQERMVAGADSNASEPRSMRLIHSSTSQPRHFGPSTREPPMPRNETAEILTEIDGLALLVRVVVQDAPAENRSDPVNVAGLHSWLSRTLEKMVERTRGSPIRGDEPSRKPLGIVEFISSGARLVRPPTETVLRIGPLELDLIDRTAKRGDRQIDLRPREFRLLKYMMQRSDNLLTRATLLKEVWHYNFVPETNLVDVHMGRLRRKVDGSNEAPMIRNVRGAGFVLSASLFPQNSPPKTTERSTIAPGQ
jgi:DNA-binding winged helix-turn-helix (wHTH) protein